MTEDMGWMNEKESIFLTSVQARPGLCTDQGTFQQAPVALSLMLKRTIHLHLVTKLKMRGALPPLPPVMPLWHAE